MCFLVFCINSVNSIGYFNCSFPKWFPLKRRNNKRNLFSQLSESDVDFITGRGNHGTRTEKSYNAADKDISLNNANRLTQASCSQMDMHTLEKKIVINVPNEVGCVTVQDAVLTAVEYLVIPREGIAMKSVNASSRRGGKVL